MSWGLCLQSMAVTFSPKETALCDIGDIKDHWRLSSHPSRAASLPTDPQVRPRRYDLAATTSPLRESINSGNSRLTPLGPRPSERWSLPWSVILQP